MYKELSKVFTDSGKCYEGNKKVAIIRTNNVMETKRQFCSKMKLTFAVTFKSNLLRHCLSTLLVPLPGNTFIYFTVSVADGFAFQTICF